MKKPWLFMNVIAFAVLVCVGNASANTTPSADFDGDGIVGIPDFLEFVEKFGSSQGDGTYQVKYDLDGNGVIGIPDFLIFVDSFGKEVPSQTVGLSVCDRTNAVRDSIVALVPVSTCGDVTAAHLSAIDSLSLSGARLTELKAGDFSGLTGLTKLNLQENRLSSLPDGLFDDLTALSRLYLGGNRLTAIPSELFNLSNLTFLNLGDNRLDGEIPTELGNLSNLTLLSLSRNQLDGEIPTESYPTLRNNQLDGEIPTELGNLSNLTELYWLVGEILGNLSNQLVMVRFQQNWANFPILRYCGLTVISWMVRFQQNWATYPSNLTNRGNYPTYLL